MTIREVLERARGEEYITAIEFAALVRYDPQTVWRKIRRGDIPGVERHGRSIRIHKMTALRWWKEKRATT